MEISDMADRPEPTQAPVGTECLICHAPVGDGARGSITVGSVSFHLCDRHAELAIGLYRLGEAGMGLGRLLRDRARGGGDKGKP